MTTLPALSLAEVNKRSGEFFLRFATAWKILLKIGVNLRVSRKYIRNIRLSLRSQIVTKGDCLTTYLYYLYHMRHRGCHGWADSSPGLGCHAAAAAAGDLRSGGRRLSSAACCPLSAAGGWTTFFGDGCCRQQQRAGPLDSGSGPLR